MTLEAIVAGDLTAKGTLIRLERRVPRVMKKWRESPITGWGFSNEYFKYADGHIGNHNILLHSGITGFLLMIAFFIYFNAMIILKSMSMPDGVEWKKGLLVFSIFFLGWFIIHSTSWQYFSFYQDPNIGTIQALFLSWGAMVFQECNRSIHRTKQKKHQKTIIPLSEVYA
jgi:O-antigen ligase